MQCFQLFRKCIIKFAIFFPLYIIVIIYTVFTRYNYTTVKVNFGVCNASKQNFSSISQTKALITSQVTLKVVECTLQYNCCGEKYFFTRYIFATLFISSLLTNLPCFQHEALYNWTYATETRNSRPLNIFCNLH